MPLLVEKILVSLITWIKDEKTNHFTNETYYKTYYIDGNKCSCHKQESKGIPCSYLIWFLQETGQSIINTITQTDGN